MFVGRRKEMQAVYDFLDGPGGVALICGKCGQGKTALMTEIFDSYRHDDTLFFYPMSDSLKQNEKRLLDGIMGLGYEIYDTKYRWRIEESFDYLDKDDNNIVVIDNYQRLAENKNYELLGETFSKIFSQHTKNLHVFIVVPDNELKNLRLEQNIMGQLDLVLHLENMSYLECAGFYPDYTPYDKAVMYAVCGGSPYLNGRMDANKTAEENIILLLNMSNAIFWHTYYATGAPDNEEQRSVLRDLAAGKRVYAGDDIPIDDATAAQLDRLEADGAVCRTTPVGDMRRSWYEITDGAVMFKYRYIYGRDRERKIEGWGHGAWYYRCYIREDFAKFTALRFTQLCREYFRLQSEKGRLDGVTAIGTWCHERDTGCSRGCSEYEIALQRGDDIEVYIPICSSEKATRDMLERYLREAALDGLAPSRVGFISVSGFEPDCEGIPNLITGEDLYRD